jgi:hypothetical protein
VKATDTTAKRAAARSRGERSVYTHEVSDAWQRSVASSRGEEPWRHERLDARSERSNEANGAPTNGVLTR